MLYVGWPTDDLQSIRPAISVHIHFGLVAEGKCDGHVDCLIDEVADKISKVMDMDSRQKIGKIDSVMDCRNGEDFAEWRMLRAANRRAEENSKNIV